MSTAKKKGADKKSQEKGLTPKHPGGRPSKYKAEIHVVLVEALAQCGMTNDQICQKMNISTSTLSKWMTEHEEFSSAIKRGREEPDDKVERSLFELATGYKHRVQKPIVVSDGAQVGSHVEKISFVEKIPPNVTAQIFWLKNRRPDRWMDRSTNLNLNLNKDVDNMSPEEENLYRENMRASLPHLDVLEAKKE